MRKIIRANAPIWAVAVAVALVVVAGNWIKPDPNASDVSERIWVFR